MQHEWIRGAATWFVCAPETQAKGRLREHIAREWGGAPGAAQALRDRDFLMRQGEPCPFVFLVQKGAVEMFMEANLLGDEARGAAGTSVVPLGRCAAGEYVGALSLCDAGQVAERIARAAPGAAGRAPLRLADPAALALPCPVSMRATGDVQALCVKAADLLAFAEGNPWARDALLEEAERRLEWVEGRLEKARAWGNGVFVQDGNGRYQRAYHAVQQLKRATATGADDAPQAQPQAQQHSGSLAATVPLPSSARGGLGDPALVRTRRDRGTRSLDIRPSSAGTNLLAAPPTVIWEGRESVAIRGELSRRLGDSSRNAYDNLPLVGDGQAAALPPGASSRGHLGRMGSKGPRDLRWGVPKGGTSAQADGPKPPLRRVSSLIGAASLGA